MLLLMELKRKCQYYNCTCSTCSMKEQEQLKYTTCMLVLDSS